MARHGKRVRWGNTTTIPPYAYKSPIRPATESYNFDNSLWFADSSAAATPSSLPYASSSYSTHELPKYRPVPQMTHTHTPHPGKRHRKPSVRAHSCLVHDQRTVPLLWDMTEQPTPQSLRSVDGSAIDWQILSLPATEPHCNHMHIRCLGFQLWHPLKFGSQDNLLRPQAISAIDVLTAIYVYLQMHITPGEYARIRSIPGLNEEVTKAFYRRCARRPFAQLELSQGLRRIDCLLGNTVFLGITLESLDSFTGYWQLRVGYSTHWSSIAAKPPR